MSIRSLTMGVCCAALWGCCTAYKGAVETYTASLPERARIYYPKVTTPELKKELVLNDASLVCLVEKDKGLSTADSPSLACKCGDGAPEQWKKNCAAWLKPVK